MPKRKINRRGFRGTGSSTGSTTYDMETAETRRPDNVYISFYSYSCVFLIKFITPVCLVLSYYTNNSLL
jgi:hypothetical protein